MTSATLRHAGWILRGNPLTAVAAAGVFLLALIAIFGPWIVPYDPIVSNVSQALMPPSAAHIAGTDQLGRDVFSRLIVAARLDLAIAVSAVGISFAIGAVIGAICGYTGGRLDRGVGRFVDVVMAFPLFVLAMAMVAALGNRVENIVIATAIINLPFYIRFARAEVNVRRNVGWVEAARACGDSHLSVVLRFLLPNVLPAMAVQISLNLGWAILNAAGLSFIGLGVKPPTPEWGIMVAEGARFISTGKWWLVAFPGLALMLTVLCFNLLGDGVRDILDPPHANMTSSLLALSDLHVTFSTRRGLVEAVRGVTLSLGEGEMLGLVGESGSGKSVTGFAITRLLDAAGRITAGHIRFRGQDITRISGSDFRHLHGAAMAMIFQNPRGALNPIRAVGDQIADAITAHKRMPRDEARAQALELLRAVQIRDPEKRMAAYPHELSGGMCQRVMIAMAISCNPALLIADEPTTGLDVTTQKVVMDLLTGIAAERGMATILITHDLGLAARYCRRVVVMEQGRLVEEADPKTLFHAPQHPYTKRLVAASPTASSRIADLVPEEERRRHVAMPAAPRPQPAPGTPPLLEVQKLAKRFDQGAAAVADFSMMISAGESVGLVGESGSGKSTTSRIICRLIDPSEGEIAFEGQSIGHIPARDFHRSPFRKDIQIVFQDPNDSLNPRFTAFDCIAHPLLRLGGMRAGDALRQRVEECAQRVGLGIELLTRFPHQLSGGQKARVGIARAIACRPRLLVLDEPTAALDVSVQAVVLQLLDRLRREDDLAFLFVSHDLNVVRMMCDRTIVLQNGRIVEQGESRAMFDNPKTAYTRELVEAVPHIEPELAAFAT